MTGCELPTAAPSWTRRTDVVVVGTGAAGLSAALPLAAAGIDCVVVTRGSVTDSATDWAQGGLAAVWGDDDSLAAHVADTLVAGAGLCDEEAVADLVAAAPGAIRRLVALGAEFDRDRTGDFDLHLEGGHSRRRIIHADGDATGHEIERALWASLSGALAGSRTSVIPGQRLVDVLTDADGAACGVRLLAADGTVGEILAGTVVLASGGLGQLWPVTSNPAVATGDGVAAALRAGAAVRDLEFVQFHPTVLADSRADERGVLISEAVRGEGAVLVDGAGRRIMAGLHPQADLAPRDVVSAAIMAHLASTGESCAYLDATGFGADKWQTHFPGILRLVRARGIDPVTQLIPVRPAAHYACGGIATDLGGATSVRGLYAVGEVAATGVQGANRLASNSLTEALVMGERVGSLLALGAPAATVAVARPTVPAVDPSFADPLRQTMQREVFVARTDVGLRRALALLDRAPARPGTVDDDALTATNLHTVAAVIAAAALRRTESRGCHRRADHPAADPAQERRLVAAWAADGPVIAHAPLPAQTRTVAA